jgi:hypothetical protein
VRFPVTFTLSPSPASADGNDGIVKMDDNLDIKILQLGSCARYIPAGLG